MRAKKQLSRKNEAERRYAIEMQQAGMPELSFVKFWDNSQQEFPSDILQCKSHKRESNTNEKGYPDSLWLVEKSTYEEKENSSRQSYQKMLKIERSHFDK